MTGYTRGYGKIQHHGTKMQTERGDKKRIPEADILLHTMRTRLYPEGIPTLHILASSTYHPDFSPRPRDKTVDRDFAPKTHAAYLLQSRRLLEVAPKQQPAILLERRTSQKKEWWRPPEYSPYQWRIAFHDSKAHQMGKVGLIKENIPDRHYIATLPLEDLQLVLNLFIERTPAGQPIETAWHDQEEAWASKLPMDWTTREYPRQFDAREWREYLRKHPVIPHWKKVEQACIQENHRRFRQSANTPSRKEPHQQPAP